MGEETVVEMTQKGSEAQPSSSADGNAMIGKGSKSSRNFGQWAWISAALPWVLTIIFFTTTVVFLTLYAVELNDDDSDSKNFSKINQQAAEQFEMMIDTGNVDGLGQLVTDDFTFYCNWPGCPLSLENFQEFLSPGFAFSTWFISYDVIRSHTEWAQDTQLVISHWNYTTEPALAPWEMKAANIEPYPHHFHGSRVFHFEEATDSDAQPLIREVYSHEWNEADYWGSVNKFTAIRVVDHLSDGNTTALESLLADDFAFFCDHVFCPVDKANFLNWFSNPNHTLSSIFDQSAKQIISEIEWAGDHFLALGHFNLTIDDYPYHGAYVFHFKSDMAQPFVGETLLVSDMFYYEWENNEDFTTFLAGFVEQIGTNSSADVNSLGDYLHEDWIGAFPSTDSTQLISKADFLSKSLEETGLQQSCMPENIVFHTEYFITEEDVPPGIRFTAMHHIQYLDANGQNTTEVAEESHHVIFLDDTGFSGDLLDGVKALYYNESSYLSGFPNSDIPIAIIRSWWRK